MEELFPLDQVQMDSPMLAWKKKHDVHTYYSTCGDDPEYLPWIAMFGEFTTSTDPDRCGYGKTEEEAMRDLAFTHRHRGIKCWNEE